MPKGATPVSTFTRRGTSSAARVSARPRTQRTEGGGGVAVRGRACVRRPSVAAPRGRRNGAPTRAMPRHTAFEPHTANRVTGIRYGISIHALMTSTEAGGLGASGGAGRRGAWGQRHLELPDLLRAPRESEPQRVGEVAEPEQVAAPVRVETALRDAWGSHPLGGFEAKECRAVTPLGAEARPPSGRRQVRVVPRLAPAQTNEGHPHRVLPARQTPALPARGHGVPSATKKKGAVTTNATVGTRKAASKRAVVGKA